MTILSVRDSVGRFAADNKMKLFIMKCHSVIFSVSSAPAAMLPLGGTSAADPLLAPAFNVTNPEPDQAGTHVHKSITFDGWAGPLSAPQDGLL